MFMFACVRTYLRVGCLYPRIQYTIIFKKENNKNYRVEAGNGDCGLNSWINMEKIR